MKVRELIAALQELNPELICCVMDQSGSWCSVQEPIEEITMTYYDLEDDCPREPHYGGFVAI